MNKIVFKDKSWEAYVDNIDNWQTFKRKRYQVKLQKALPDKEYNVTGKPGVVYNILENCEESVVEADYIVTGLLGEMWPISKKSLASYEATDEEIEEEPKPFFTRISNKVYFGLQVPVEVSFSVEMPKHGTLNGNSDSDRISHGLGDYLVCNSFEEGDYRIVNGEIFQKMYEFTK